MTLELAITRVLSETNSAPRSLVEQYLLTAARDFCRHTSIWTRTTEQDLIAGQQDYVIEEPDDVSVVGTIRVKADGTFFTPINELNPPLYTPTNSYSVDHDTQTITLSRNDIPDLVGGLTIIAWYQPETLEAIPPSIWNNYTETLVEGTLSKMFQTPNRPYTNFALGSLHGKRFKGQKGRARRAAMSSRSNSEVGWRFPLDTRSRSLRN